MDYSLYLVIEFLKDPITQEEEFHFNKAKSKYKYFKTYLLQMISKSLEIKLFHRIVPKFIILV